MTGNSPLILYIDDNKDNLLLVERYLAPSYRVSTAENGVDGLQEAGRSHPSLILLDIMMPGMDGYEVCSRLQEDDATSFIPVIFVTALGEEKDKARAFAVGAADYLVKPIRKPLLLEKIERHLQTTAQWSRLREEAGPWQERVQPLDFIRFKEFLADKAELSSENRLLITNTVPSGMYRDAESLGIPEETLARHMADFTDLPYLGQINPEDTLMGVLPAAFSRNNHVVAVSTPEGENGFVISNPFDFELIDTLVNLFHLDGSSRVSITYPGNIDSLLGEITVRISAGSSDRQPRETETVKSADPSVRLGREAQEKPIVRITNSILNAAVAERASDIHIEPKENETIVRFRIDGDLRNAFKLKTRTGIMVISRLKIIGGLDIAEKRKPQDGAFVAEQRGRTLNVRLSTTSTPNGESLVMRLLEPYSEPKSLTELGMLEEQSRAMVRIANKSNGIILIVGATGSGKTTTIYSLLHNIDHERRSLMSVEDPVEYRMPFVNQQQVNEKAGVTFEALLKTAVRQDPDVLFMGEVRDSFSARIAIDFSSTGHLTITTLHTSNATSALFRLERLGVERGVIANTLLAVVAQKLVKKLCPHCRKVTPVSPEEETLFRLFTEEVPSRVAHPGPGGCEKCGGTGYLGREGVYEVLEFDPQIVEMVESGVPVSDIREFVRKRGDYLISTHAIHKAGQLMVSPEEIYEKVLAEELTERGLGSGTAIFSSEPLSEADPAVLESAEEIGGGEEEATAGPAEMGKEELPAPGEVGQKSIMVVDDDKSTRDLIVRFLENDGYVVFTAGDGIEALLQLGSRKFDLIISDIDMPNLDGFKLLEMVSQKGLESPVILLTSREAPEDEERGLELGAMDYIRKPFRKELLLLRVKRTLQARR